MNASPLRIAVIGLGKQGEEHLRACLRNQHLIAVRAVVDPRFGAEQNFSPDEIPDGCMRFQSIEQIPPELIQAAVLATPPAAYEALLPDLMDKGLHLLVEKPLGLNLKQAISMLDKAALHQLVLMPTAQRRYHRSYEQALAAIRDKMGDISQVVFQLDLDKKSSGWRQDVGCLVDLGFHAIDFMRALFGDIHLISSTLFDSQGHPCRDRNKDAEAHLLFKVESGAFLRVVVRAGERVVKKLELLEVQSPTHQLRADRASLKLTRNDGTVVLNEYFDKCWDEAMDTQLLKFAEHVRSAPDGDDWLELSSMFSLITMKLIEEIYAAASVA